jgi:hypothetical protein
MLRETICETPKKETRSVHRWCPNGQNMKAVVMAMAADAVNSV